MTTWPVAEVDPIRRLRVLAAAVPGAVVTEATYDAPYPQVWAVAADLEHELPRYLPDVRTLRITHRDGDRLEAHARGYAGLRARFDIVLRPGWCIMRSRFLLGGLAAVPDQDRTRFAFLSGVHVPGQRAMAPGLTRLGHVAGRQVLDRLAEQVRLRS
jgi:hypothetical protein